MNAVIENMLSRRSVRSYTDQPVEPELLKTILDCGLYAPTGHNSQRTRIFVQQKPETIAALNVIVQRELLAHVLTENDVMASSIARAKTPNYHFMHHAGVLISVAGPRDYSNSMAECAAAVENMLLAAHSLGLGGCWINQPNWFPIFARCLSRWECVTTRSSLPRCAWAIRICKLRPCRRARTAV